MRQSSLSLPSAIAAAYFDSSIAMYSRPRPRSNYRGGGRGQARRGYSDGQPRPWTPENQAVTVDSHFHPVGATNLGFHAPAGAQNNRNFSYNGTGNDGRFRGQSYAQRPRPEFRPNSPADYGFRPPYTGNQRPDRPFQPPQHGDHHRQQWPRRPKPMDYRNWESAKNPPPPKCERFSILSYNILADYLANNHRGKLYFHIPYHFLAWESRRRSMVFELGLWSPDIMCFQEVDRFGDLEEVLKTRGYMGTYKMRTGNPVDGCAIFWRTSRFKLVHDEYIEFNKIGMRDNVAQICVLESLIHNGDQSALSESPIGRSKVVVCNIHVLYNPRRGEIKLGQVRVLLDKAQAVSKIWNDAPVVICGDFNCTPKSPLYDFISEQKLDLSRIDRDKVSGQASAEIPQQPRGINPRSEIKSKPSGVPIPSVAVDMGTDCLDNAAIVKQLSSRGRFENSVPSEAAALGESSFDAKLQNSFSDAENSKNVSGVAKDAVDHPVSPNMVGIGSSSIEVTMQSFQDEVDSSNDEIRAASHVSDNHLKDSQGAYSTRDVDSAYLSIDASDTISEHATTEEKIVSSFAESSQEYKVTHSQFEMHVEVHGVKHESKKSSTAAEDHFIKEGGSEELSTSLEAEPSSLQEENTPGASLEVECDPTENVEGLSPGEINDNAEVLVEDSENFLSDLHFGDDNLGDLSPGIDFDSGDLEKPAYDPSTWTPIELATATGNADCTLVEHPLKLRSTYAEVEGSAETRDSSGEPVLTSYNKCFLGTVDYIWRSEGLQTVRVLAPLPKRAVQWTKGFPTKKWGSDHIALVSELAFTKDGES